MISLAVVIPIGQKKATDSKLETQIQSEFINYVSVTVASPPASLRSLLLPVRVASRREGKYYELRIGITLYLLSSALSVVVIP
ncbi:hypothetical protein [Nostoc sp.]|uniref:hypothetical protein n=1 Tax=Nostoc sp. TaxID=1180 RepID=UPI002FF75E2E